MTIRPRVATYAIGRRRGNAHACALLKTQSPHRHGSSFLLSPLRLSLRSSTPDLFLFVSEDQITLSAFKACCISASIRVLCAARLRPMPALPILDLVSLRGGRSPTKQSPLCGVISHCLAPLQPASFSRLYPHLLRSHLRCTEQGSVHVSASHSNPTHPSPGHPKYPKSDRKMLQNAPFLPPFFSSGIPAYPQIDESSSAL